LALPPPLPLPLAAAPKPPPPPAMTTIRHPGDGESYANDGVVVEDRQRGMMMTNAMMAQSASCAAMTVAALFKQEGGGGMGSYDADDAAGDDNDIINTRCAWAGGTCAKYPDVFENNHFHVIYCVTLAYAIFLKDF